MSARVCLRHIRLNKSSKANLECFQHGCEGMCPCFAPSLKVHPSWDVKVCAGGPHHCFLAFLSIRMSCETLLPTFARKAEAHRSSAPDFGGRLSPNAPQSLRKREAAPRSVPHASFPFFAQLPRGRSAPAGCQAGRRPTARRELTCLVSPVCGAPPGERRTPRPPSWPCPDSHTSARLFPVRRVSLVGALESGLGARNAGRAVT